MLETLPAYAYMHACVPDSLNIYKACMCSQHVPDSLYIYNTCIYNAYICSQHVSLLGFMNLIKSMHLYVSLSQESLQSYEAIGPPPQPLVCAFVDFSSPLQFRSPLAMCYCLHALLAYGLQAMATILHTSMHTHKL
jgi:hypothetical protein